MIPLVAGYRPKRADESFLGCCLAALFDPTCGRGLTKSLHPSVSLRDFGCAALHTRLLRHLSTGSGALAGLCAWQRIKPIQRTPHQCLRRRLLRIFVPNGLCNFFYVVTRGDALLGLRNHGLLPARLRGVGACAGLALEARSCRGFCWFLAGRCRIVLRMGRVDISALPVAAETFAHSQGRALVVWTWTEVFNRGR